jgi:hypothetical protein
LKALSVISLLLSYDAIAPDQENFEKAEKYTVVAMMKLR